ncbi:MAG: hypothetical protein K2M65_03890 [Muribaculaceae bacterium]|nr:hypothetical protein [Muribaculaceae bacterium]
MEQSIKYRNEEDKSYGLTGMAISVVVWDCDHLLAAVSIDGENAESMEMTPEFYFNGNPGLSAKSAWTQMVEHFQLSTAMLLANVMCRRLVNDKRSIDSELKSQLLGYVLDEGRESCSLDDDESTRIFDKCYTYCTRLFNHYGVAQVAVDFARKLRDRRRLTRSEVLEELSVLNRF